MTDPLTDPGTRRLDPRRLLILRAVARAGSMTAGARRLGWTQSAVSQHMAALERSVGMPLLLRGAGGVDLTEAGRRLLVHADAVAVQLAAAEQELAALADLERGRATLASFPSAAAVLVPPALARLAESAPGVDVHVAEAEPPEALQLLREGEADLALVFGYAEQDDPVALVRHRLGDDDVRLVLPAGDRRTRLDELADADWVVGCERCRAHLLACCDAAGFAPRVRHTTDDYVVVQGLVAAGIAVAALPQTALDAFRHPGVVVHAEPALGARRVEVVHRPGVERVPAVAATLAALGAIA